MAAEIGEVRRQREDWQREAMRDLASGRIGIALELYRFHGSVHEAKTREQARGDLIGYAVDETLDLLSIGRTAPYAAVKRGDP